MIKIILTGDEKNISKRILLFRLFFYYALSVLLALSISLILIYFLKFQITSLLYRLLALAIFTALSVCPVHMTIFNFIRPRIALYPQRIMIAWYAFCSVAGFSLMSLTASHLTEFHTIEIIAVGEKNFAAKGSEVWVVGRRLNVGNNLDTPDFVSDGSWERREQDLVSYKNQPARLRWSGRLRYSGAVSLLMHPWSGVVEVIWDDNSQTVDLYSTKRGFYTARAPAKYGTNRVALMGALTVTFGFACFLISVLIITLPVRE